MKSLQCRWLIAGLCSLLAASLFDTNFALAQTGAVVKPPPVNSPKIVLTYKSTFDRYKPYSDEKAANWKAANDEVGRIGGWRAYLKEAQEPDAAPAPAQTKPVAPSQPAGSASPAPTGSVAPLSPSVPSSAKPLTPINPHAHHNEKK